ncbi:hypothetical protein NC652_012006 [Populus alba x Populus x berolinensis]|uniref:Uncharacterized protein n=1 Tax=Populus alba x Populus x berolinensis TaxID=444605 RepID=A0AAD6R3W4_9ROSI|nr:hypothetical protein NC652_012006 [Populus alba x Populus x berolinensis]KAJ7001905.1 hypothetical protein NC653_012092 [Populus alba x Populus x berolinensis]
MCMDCSHSARHTSIGCVQLPLRLWPSLNCTCMHYQAECYVKNN